MPQISPSSMAAACSAVRWLVVANTVTFVVNVLLFAGSVPSLGPSDSDSRSLDVSRDDGPNIGRHQRRAASAGHGG